MNAAPLQIAVRAARRWWLGYQIRETEAYLHACARDGLVDSLSLREWRAQLQALRVDHALLLASASGPRQPAQQPAPAEAVADLDPEPPADAQTDDADSDNLGPARGIILAAAIGLLIGALAIAWAVPAP